ncbi:hypothetical protein DID78_06850 [Candidatus Marinamargulisbacteria bacterium SCGC AG-343-D04]|nr:hypothetical protein DID78_06850 [Candidatus Marinamargulisbacteria bacterium SCGC AG-343-D04]
MRVLKSGQFEVAEVTGIDEQTIVNDIKNPKKIYIDTGSEEGREDRLKTVEGSYSKSKPLDGLDAGVELGRQESIKAFEQTISDTDTIQTGWLLRAIEGEEGVESSDYHVITWFKLPTREFVYADPMLGILSFSEDLFPKSDDGKDLYTLDFLFTSRVIQDIGHFPLEISGMEEVSKVNSREKRGAKKEGTKYTKLKRYYNQKLRSINLGSKVLLRKSKKGVSPEEWMGDEQIKKRFSDIILILNQAKKDGESYMEWIHNPSRAQQELIGLKDRLIHGYEDIEFTPEITHAQYREIGRYVDCYVDCIERNDHINPVKSGTKDAEQGNSQVQNALGWMYQHGKGVEKDLNEALRLYLLAADKGEANAQNNLACMLRDGKGVDQDLNEAIRLYTLAAKQGDKDAQYNLGNMYRQGKGVDPDMSEEERMKEAVKWYILAADQGFSGAQNNLGWMHVKGKGVEKSYKKAFEWYTKAAEKGHAVAQYSLGNMYITGKGVAKDLKEAVRLYRLAADQEFAKAQKNLGNMYREGKGVDQDLNEAIRLYSLAAKQGNEDAQYNLGCLYLSGEGVDQNFQEAFRLVELAADH